LQLFAGYISALAPKFCTKNARVNVDEIDTRSVVVNTFNIMERSKHINSTGSQNTKKYVLPKTLLKKIVAKLAEPLDFLLKIHVSSSFE